MTWTLKSKPLYRDPNEIVGVIMLQSSIIGQYAYIRICTIAGWYGWEGLGDWEWVVNG